MLLEDLLRTKPLTPTSMQRWIGMDCDSTGHP